MLSPYNNDDLGVPPGELEFIHEVGSGAYAEVWTGKWKGKGGGITVAIKKVPVSWDNKEAQREVLFEVGIQSLFPSQVLALFIFCFAFFHVTDLLFDFKLCILTKLKHPSIVTIFGSCYYQNRLIEERELWIVMEYMAGGSLSGWLHDSTLEITWDTRLR